MKFNIRKETFDDRFGRKYMRWRFAMYVSKKNFIVNYSVRSPKLNKENIVWRISLIDRFERDDEVKKELAAKWKVDKIHIIIHKVEVEN